MVQLASSHIFLVSPLMLWRWITYQIRWDTHFLENALHSLGDITFHFHSVNIEVTEVRAEDLDTFVLLHGWYRGKERTHEYIR